MSKNLQVEGFPKKFPCGEVFVRSSKDLVRCNTSNANGEIWIDKQIQNSDDIMEILMLNDALRRLGSKNVCLRIPYVPYSRQDRVMTEGESLSIKVFADLINSCNFSIVEIWDPHSDVTTALLNNVKVIDQSVCLGKLVYSAKTRVYDKVKDFILVSPDAGARKKILSVAKYFGIEKVLYADKVREVSTGKILRTELNIGTFEGNHFLIVDDICDGGMTFIELAKAIIKQVPPTGNAYLHLHVTHGFFTKGLDELCQYFSSITCTNLMNDELSRDPHIFAFYKG